MTAPIFTIGRSNHGFARFAELLNGAGIETVIDVRSQPVSRWVPHFNRTALESALAALGIGYVFLGRELGGRPADPELRRKGKPDYAAMAQAPSFRSGIERVIEMRNDKRIALMCAERDPADCHRFMLIGRELAAHGRSVAHILADGTLEDQQSTEERVATAPHPRLL